MDSLSKSHRHGDSKKVSVPVGLRLRRNRREPPPGRSRWQRGVPVAILLMTWIGGTPAWAIAQQGSGADSTGSTVQDLVDPQEQARAVPLIEQAVRDADPRTPQELVNAIETLLRVDSEELAKTYLIRLAGLPWDDEKYHRIYRLAGPAFILDLARRSGLQPEGRAFADQVLDAARRVSYNPDRLNELTRKLSDPNIYVRSDTLKQLRQTGATGAAAIVNALANEERRDEFPWLRAALAKLGQVAEGPLLGAILSDHQPLILEASNALGFIKSRKSLAALYRPYLIGSTRQHRRVAAAALERRLGIVPSQAEAQIALKSALQDYIRPVDVDPFEPETYLDEWNWDGEKMVVTRRRTHVSRHRFAAKLAETLHRYQGQDPEYRNLYLIAALQAIKSTNGIDTPLEEAVADSLHRRFSHQQVLVALQQALDRDHAEAAAAACELLTRYNDPAILDGAHGDPSSLVAALQFGDLRVTYAAAHSIASLATDEQFAGSSYYLSSLIYLAASAGQRKVVIGHNDVTAAQTLGEFVAKAGYQPVLAGSARQLFSIATSDPDVQAILITDRLHQPDYIELVQTLRRDPRTKRIPVGLLYRESSKSRMDSYGRQDPLTATFPMALDPSLVARQLERLRLRRGLDTLQPETRLEYALWANQQLAQLASDPARGYDLAAHQEQVADGILRQPVTRSAARYLARVGTPFAQRKLLAIVTQPSLPIEVRRATLQELKQAFEAKGLLLTRDEIQQLYDAYNQNTSEPAESRQLRSDLLDVIESQAK